MGVDTVKGSSVILAVELSMKGNNILNSSKIFQVNMLNFLTVFLVDLIQGSALTFVRPAEKRLHIHTF
jgi:hypothetical protein